MLLSDCGDGDCEVWVSAVLVLRADDLALLALAVDKILYSLCIVVAQACVRAR